MAIYMKFPDIDGTVTEKEHKDWIELQSLEWGVSRRIASAVGTDKNRMSDLPKVYALTGTKLNDKASGKLMALMLDKKAKEVKIHYTRAGTSGSENYIEMELDNVLVGSFQLDSSGGDRPLETITLFPTKVEFTTEEMKADAEKGGPSRVVFNMATAETDD